MASLGEELGEEVAKSRGERSLCVKEEGREEFGGEVVEAGGDGDSCESGEDGRAGEGDAL